MTSIEICFCAILNLANKNFGCSQCNKYRKPVPSRGLKNLLGRLGSPIQRAENPPPSSLGFRPHFDTPSIFPSPLPLLHAGRGEAERTQNSAGRTHACCEPTKTFSPKTPRRILPLHLRPPASIAQTKLRWAGEEGGGKLSPFPTKATARKQKPHQRGEERREGRGGIPARSRNPAI